MSQELSLGLSAANEEYFQLLLSSEQQSCGAGVPSYTLEQIQSATSEVVVKSTVSVSGTGASREPVTVWPVAHGSRVWRIGSEFRPEKRA